MIQYRFAHCITETTPHGASYEVGRQYGLQDTQKSQPACVSEASGCIFLSASLPFTFLTARHNSSAVRGHTRRCDFAPHNTQDLSHSLAAFCVLSFWGGGGGCVSHFRKGGRGSHVPVLVVLCGGVWLVAVNSQPEVLFSHRSCPSLRENPKMRAPVH